MTAFADRTGGNPFFVVELFRHLKDEGRLFGARNEWVRDLDLSDVELPDTVRVVLERRMTRVSSDTQDLQRPSIQGRWTHHSLPPHRCPYDRVDVQIAAQRPRSQNPSPHSPSFVQLRAGTFLDQGREGSSFAIA